MIRTTLAIAYFSYLLVGGGSMTQGMRDAEKPSASHYQANVCRLLPDTKGCTSSM
ncbi:MAG: hypothetical protein K2Q01_06160 [Rickettsiales bacterium]|nr:hypothetical protein [Rickettsiales bacterium]